MTEGCSKLSGNKAAVLESFEPGLKLLLKDYMWVM